MRNMNVHVTKHIALRSTMLVCLAATTMLAGCTKSANTATGSPSPSQTSDAQKSSIPNKEFKIKVMSWQGPEEQYGPAYNEAFAQYMKLHPNVKIEHLYQPNANNGYDKLLDTQFVAHEAPDAMQLTAGAMKKYADQDYLLRLDGYMQQPTAYGTAKWIDTFTGGEKAFSTLKSANKYGSIMTIPVDGGPGGAPLIPFYYNKDIFAKAGVAKPPETWKEFIEACKKIKAAGYDPVAADGGRFLQWMTFFTDNQLDPGHLASQFDEKYRIPELASDILNLSVLTGKHKADDPVDSTANDIIKDFAQYWQQGWAGINADQAKQLFLLGKAAMYEDGNWDYSYFEKNVKGFSFGVIPFPLITKETTPYAAELMPAAGDKQSYGWSLNKDLEKDPDKLKVVIDIYQFMTSKETQETMSTKGVFIPVISGLTIPEKVKPFMISDKNKILSPTSFSSPLFALATDGAAIMQTFLLGQSDKNTAMNKLWQQASDKAKKTAADALDAKIGVPNQIDTLQKTYDKQKADNAPDNVTKATADSLAIAKLKLEFYKQYAEPLLK